MACAWPGGHGLAVFFHPDCDRRLRHPTGSADPPAWPEALAGLSRRPMKSLATYRRWGVSPRPEDVTWAAVTAMAILAPGPGLSGPPAERCVGASRRFCRSGFSRDLELARANGFRSRLKPLLQELGARRTEVSATYAAARDRSSTR